jgi:hypothetical protein
VLVLTKAILALMIGFMISVLFGLIIIPVLRKSNFLWSYLISNDIIIIYLGYLMFVVI